MYDVMCVGLFVTITIHASVFLFLRCTVNGQCIGAKYEDTWCTLVAANKTNQEGSIVNGGVVWQKSYGMIFFFVNFLRHECLMDASGCSMLCRVTVFLTLMTTPRHYMLCGTVSGFTKH